MRRVRLTRDVPQQGIFPFRHRPKPLRTPRRVMGGFASQARGFDRREREPRTVASPRATRARLLPHMVDEWPQDSRTPTEGGPVGVLTNKGGCVVARGRLELPTFRVMNPPRCRCATSHLPSYYSLSTPHTGSQDGGCAHREGAEHEGRDEHDPSCGAVRGHASRMTRARGARYPQSYLSRFRRRC
jgi:hypothetical protein